MVIANRLLMIFVTYTMRLIMVSDIHRTTSWASISLPHSMHTQIQQQ